MNPCVEFRFIPTDVCRSGKVMYSAQRRCRWGWRTVETALDKEAVQKAKAEIESRWWEGPTIAMDAEPCAERYVIHEDGKMAVEWPGMQNTKG